MLACESVKLLRISPPADMIVPIDEDVFVDAFTPEASLLWKMPLVQYGIRFAWNHAMLIAGGDDKPINTAAVTIAYNLSCNLSYMELRAQTGSNCAYAFLSEQAQLMAFFKSQLASKHSHALDWVAMIDRLEGAFRFCLETVAEWCNADKIKSPAHNVWLCAFHRYGTSASHSYVSIFIGNLF